MTTCEKMTGWVLETVKRDYPEDIALVIRCGNLRIDTEEMAVDYYVPATPRGDRLAFTAIVEGVGYDVWPLHWERLERLARMEEDYIACILYDGEILYARSDEDTARFTGLQKQLRANLQNADLMRKKALTCYAQAKAFFADLPFSEENAARVAAGNLIDALALAVAYENGQLFRYAQTRQPEELAGMERVPNGFDTLYRAVIRENDAEKRISLCRDLIEKVRIFLEPPALEPSERNFQDLACWYDELSYTWLRIRHYCGLGDEQRAYMWGVYLQGELDSVCADFGLPQMALMVGFHADNLPAFAAHADRLEQQMRRYITEGGGVIHEYNTFEDFVHAV